MGVIERLRSGDLVVLDGATGTELEARGAPQTSDASWAECSATHPEIVRDVHEDYVRAGADIITTNTYSAGPHVLRQMSREDAIAPWNRACVAIARDAIANAACGREVLVAGSVSAYGNGAMRYPSMDGRFTWGEDNPDRLGANFHEQITILVDAGVDLILFEFLGATMPDIEIGLGRALEFGLPVAASLSAAVNDEGTAVLTDITAQSEIGTTGVTAGEAVPASRHPVSRRSARCTPKSTRSTPLFPLSAPIGRAPWAPIPTVRDSGTDAAGSSPRRSHPTSTPGKPAAGLNWERPSSAGAAVRLPP